MANADAAFGFVPVRHLSGSGSVISTPLRALLPKTSLMEISALLMPTVRLHLILLLR